MKTILCILAAIPLLFVAGCATQSSTWVTSVKTDQFTDVTTKKLSLNYSTGPYGVFKLSIFAATRTNEVLVGVCSESGMPVGTVQLRVDQNPAWTISPNETPVYLSPAMLVMTNSMMTAEQSQAIMASVTKIMSPFTATTGDKARQILKQMSEGKILRYRTLGANQQTSTTGEIPIESSFINGLKTIGVEVSK